MALIKYRSINQMHFAALLKGYPKLVQFWDFDTGCMNAEGLKRSMQSMSHGEQVLAKFFACLWLGQNDWNFDLFEATSVLDRRNMRTIQDWIDDPFWP